MNALSSREREFLNEHAVPLLKRIGLGTDFEFQRLRGGRNNRVYLVSGAGPEAIVKWYFYQPQDPRDRLQAEYAFCQYAHDCGAGCVPRPLACDEVSRIGIYSALDGRKLQPDEVDPSHVAQAISFLRLLNVQREDEAARHLLPASEACFSLQAHVACVAKRVARLQVISPSDAEHEAALRLVNEKISPAVQAAETKLHEWANAAGVAMSAELPRARRCISPSDFGFHNALLRADGSLAFVDFEYAGWDDPAKTVCDFFCQVEVPAPRAAWDEFANAVAEFAADPVLERERFAALLPLYRVKWSCILMNEFLPDAADRRDFADTSQVDLPSQLRMAARAIERLV